MDLPGDVLLDRVWPHKVDLWPEWSISLTVLGTLPSIISGLPTTETRIVARALLGHWVGHDILDLGGGLVNILLPIGLVFHLSLLPGMSLLHWLNIFPRLELALVIVSGRFVVMYELVLPFSNEGLVYQSLEIGEIKHTEGASEMLV